MRYAYLDLEGDFTEGGGSSLGTLTADGDLQLVDACPSVGPP